MATAHLADSLQAGAEWVLKPNPLHLATELCDGLSKALYGRMFDWLQRQVSNALAITKTRFVRSE